MTDVPSEKTQAKAGEYLLSGQVIVRFCERTDDGRGFFDAFVYSKTDPGDPYCVGYNDTRGWHCDCPARVPTCAHVLACMTITGFENPEKAPSFLPTDSSLDDLLGS